MKRIALFVASIIFVFPIAVNAASFVVTPASGSYNVGDIITLSVSANPAGSTIYTAMLDARFSASTLEVVSFTLNDALLPLKQSGYDALDNTNGILTKTGGYTGGITTSGSFGTVVFRAKAAGTGTVTVADTSKLLDSNNTDQESGTQTSSYTIVAKPEPQTVPAPQTATQTTNKQEAPAIVKTSAPKATTVATANATETPATSTQVAAAGATGMNTILLWVLAIIGLIVAFGTGYFAGFRKYGR